MKKRWYLTIPLAAALLLGGLAVSRISRSPSLEEQIVEAVGYPEALNLAEDLTFFETVQAGSITVRGFIHPLESSYCGVAPPGHGERPASCGLGPRIAPAARRPRLLRVLLFRR